MKNENTKYKAIIGLEIHVELNTKSKMFCQCEADYFGAKPNTHTCPVCLGMPGALPVPNREAVERTILLSKALNCTVNNEFKFDRKHYFYPDLPKGYQISQYDAPIGENGSLEIKTAEGVKKFRITRVHLEEDTGKLTHSGDDSLIDFNRSGVPLVEIVTEADFDNGTDAKQFLQELQMLVRHLGIANADMEKGDMRLEPNISVQLVEKLPEFPPYKVEVKNINSFNFVKKAIEFEIDRHITILEGGEFPVQETRGYDSSNSTTVSQRVKEEAADYRYFPEPDIPPFVYSDKQLTEITDKMPELPMVLRERYVNDFGLKEESAMILVKNKELSSYFEAIVKAIGTDVRGAGQGVANALINKKISMDLSPEEFAKRFVEAAKPIETDKDLLSSVVADVLKANEKAVADYKSGKSPNAIMFLMGQVMKEMKGAGDASVVKSYLEKELS